jgi:hypothetical protein
VPRRCPLLGVDPELQLGQRTQRVVMRQVDGDAARQIGVQSR